jgi:hypothetical protein
LRLYVKDSDAVCQQALKAGATSVTNMTEHFFGDRVGRVRDPFGNLWWIQTHQAVDPEEMARRAAEQTYIDAMQYFQSSLDHELSSRRSEDQVVGRTDVRSFRETKHLLNNLGGNKRKTGRMTRSRIHRKHQIYGLLERN